jgi:hypothetical protein
MAPEGETSPRPEKPRSDPLQRLPLRRKTQLVVSAIIHGFVSPPSTMQSKNFEDPTTTGSLCWCYVGSRRRLAVLPAMIVVVSFEGCHSMNIDFGRLLPSGHSSVFIIQSGSPPRKTYSTTLTPRNYGSSGSRNDSLAYDADLALHGWSTKPKTTLSAISQCYPVFMAIIERAASWKTLLQSSYDSYSMFRGNVKSLSFIYNY